MTCSDVKERFNYLILLLMILIRNMAEFDWQFGRTWSIIRGHFSGSFLIFIFTVSFFC